MIEKIEGIQATSDYLLFIDESGDHGLSRITDDYPIFVLCGVLIKKEEYLARLCPSMGSFKMSFWGHDQVILHEKEIRKSIEPFDFLRVPNLRASFHDHLGKLMAENDYQLIYSLIKKREYVARYPAPKNPYELSMSFVLERAFLQLHSIGQSTHPTCVVVECRGRVEDAQLRSAFDRIIQGDNACGRPLPFTLTMTSKAANSPGLQIADIAARPIGIRSLRPDQPNRAYEIIKAKIRRDKNGKAEGWGVKISP